jgi:transcriptional antiterminator RfaH
LVSFSSIYNTSKSWRATKHRYGGSLLVFGRNFNYHLRITSVHWYCLHTKPLKEGPVASFCGERLGLETYFPRLRQQRTIRRQRKTVTGPLFPRYLFCRFDASLHFRAVRYAPDVATIVATGATPAIVADSLINNLRSWTSDGEGGDVVALKPAIQPGDPVEIVAGPMQGLSGIIMTECNERNRVKILLSFLQHGAHLSVDLADLRLIA